MVKVIFSTDWNVYTTTKGAIEALVADRDEIKDVMCNHVQGDIGGRAEAVVNLTDGRTFTGRDHKSHHEAVKSALRDIDRTLATACEDNTKAKSLAV